MAKLKIYRFPDVVLSKKAAPIERVEKTYFKVADDMLETMYDAPGIGLAANQVGLLERIIVVDTDYNVVDPEDLKDGEAPPGDAEVINGQFVSGKKPLILINPHIVYREGKSSMKEACLSVPDFQSEVQRADKIKVEYQTIDGLTQTLSADGLMSICLQHEIDHLDGTLFIDRLSKLKQDFAKKKLIKARQRGET